MILPGTAAIPAVHADRLRAAEATGAAAVRLIGSKLTPDRIVNAEVGRERAARAAGDRRLDQCDHPSHRDRRPRRHRTSRSTQLNELSDTTPVLVNLKPVGNGYMEDFFAAGGMGALLRELKPLLHLDCLTVTGETLGERLDGDAGSLGRPRDHRARATSRSSRRAAWSRCSATSRRKGAILKRSAADAEAVRARGPGGGVHLARRSRRAHRRSGARRRRRTTSWCCRTPARTRPAMPEAGYLPIPKKLAQRGRQGHGAHLRRAHERHRLRHHRAARHADAASGGPLGLVRNGDRIRLSVKERAHRPAGRRGRAEEARGGAEARDRDSPSAATPSSTPRKSSAPTKAAISSFCVSCHARAGGASSDPMGAFARHRVPEITGSSADADDDNRR